MLIGNYFKTLEQKYKSHFFSGISFNSLKIKKKDIFFAIRGNKINANKFIKDAIKKGAKTIVSESKFKGKKNNILYINSKNVRRSLAITSYKIFKEVKVFKPKSSRKDSKESFIICKNLR